MSRGWFLVLALSVGLNAGLLWVQLTGRVLPAGPSSPPFAERPGPPPAFGMRDPDHVVQMHLERMTAQLDLTVDQRGAIEATLLERVPRLLELRERMLDARRSAAEAYGARPLDGTRFQEFVRNLRSAQAELDSLTADLMLREADVLTPEQRERYATVMPWGIDRPGPGPGPGPPAPRPPGRGRRRGV